jgi:Tfp pilus assembly protein PilZ
VAIVAFEMKPSHSAYPWCTHFTYRGWNYIPFAFLPAPWVCGNGKVSKEIHAWPWIGTLLAILKETERSVDPEIQEGASMDTLMREFPRMESDVTVECDFDGQMLRTRALNFGGGGMFLNQAYPSFPYFPVTVRFRAARHMEPIQALAEARHQVPGLGVGLRFTEIALTDRNKILHLILFHRGGTRENPRARMVTQVEHVKGMFLGFSRAISAEGMFIDTKENWAVGTEFLLRFRLSENNFESLITASARVAYAIERLGVGIKFMELTVPDHERIKACAAGNPDSCAWAVQAPCGAAFAACA